MARRIGRAWGNALGGYKRQRRDSKGRFTTGKVGGRAKAAAKRARKKYNNRGGRAATTYRNASKRKYNKNNLNKQLQRNHRATIAANMVGAYGGYAAGFAAGGALAGGTGALVGGKVGGVYGHIAAGAALRKSGMLVTDAQFVKAGKDDQAAMARRIKRVRRTNAAIQIAGAGLMTHRVMQASGGYGLAAQVIRENRAAAQGRANFSAARGIPRTGTQTSYARAGRFGRNRGVYNITSPGTSGARIRRASSERLIPRAKGRARYAQHRIRTEAGYARSAFYDVYGR